jgi:hypothetical protein
LVIDHKLFRYRRPPQIERIVLRVVACGPIVVGWHKVNVERKLAVAAPWVSGIKELVGAQHMPAHAPALRVAGL